MKKGSDFKMITQKKAKKIEIQPYSKEELDKFLWEDMELIDGLEKKLSAEERFIVEKLAKDWKKMKKFKK